MLKLEGNKIVYHDGIEYAEIDYTSEEVVLKVTPNPLLSSEISDLVGILRTIEAHMDDGKPQLTSL